MLVIDPVEECCIDALGIVYFFWVYYARLEGRLENSLVRL